MSHAKPLSTYRIFKEQVTDPLQNTFLEAVFERNAEIVKKCVEKNVDPNLTDDDDLTALHHCAIRGDMVMGKVLLSASNIKVDVAAPEGYTPLMYACIYGNDKFVECLLNKGANPNCRNGKRQTAIHMACVLNSVKITRLLIIHGAKVNAVDTFDSTPLSIAVIDRGSVALSILLLKNGASATLKRQFPLLLECVLNCNTLDRLQIIKILLHYSPDIDIYCVHPVNKKNCLHFVGITGYLPAAKSLVKRGEENLYGTDYSGRTPVDVARDQHNTEVYKYYVDWLKNKELVSVFEEDIIVNLDNMFEEQDNT